MKLSPYLSFNGQCEAAFKFYEQCLGGTITAMMTYAESPDPAMTDYVPPDWQNKIMHTSLLLDDQEIMGSDNPPQYHEQPQGISVSISLEDSQKAERIFNQLAENGKIQMPFQKTFWAERFGMVVDQFGIPWMINCESTS